MEEKEGLMIRMNALNNAHMAVDIEERMGYFKKEGVTEDVTARIHLYYNKYIEWLTTGKQPFEDFQKPAIQPQLIKTQPIKFTPVKRDTNMMCIDCGQPLSQGELNFAKKNDTEYICYPCEKKRNIG